MKSSIISGLIAGLVSGTISFIIAAYIFEGMTLGVSIPNIAATNIVLGGIWGAIIGVLYATFYSYIPGEDVRKGIVFGLIIWIIDNVRTGVIGAVHGNFMGAVLGIVSGIIVWTVYGIVLGYLYKK